jgi:hypothetical protein
MEEKGWHIDRLQFPDALHAMVTAPHEKVVDQYIADLKEAVEIVKAHPELADKGQAATYGLVAHLPLRGMVRKQVLDIFANSYKLNAEEIDLSDSDAVSPGSGESEDGKKSLLDKIISWYVKKQSAKSNK